MTLFDSDSRYREKKTIWRLLQRMELRWGMADGHIYRWYAANIPMGIVQNAGFEGDIDLIVCLREGRGLNASLFYKTWEVKVSLVDRLGRPRSLKAGKKRDLVKQLQLHRNFGCPSPSLLEMFVCEYGFGLKNQFPPEAAANAIRDKANALSKEGYGYEFLPFEQTQDGHKEVDPVILYRPNFMWEDPMLPSAIRILKPRRSTAENPFVELTAMLNQFFDSERLVRKQRGNTMIITYCGYCRKFVLLTMRMECECYRCGADLTCTH